MDKSKVTVSDYKRVLGDLEIIALNFNSEFSRTDFVFIREELNKLPDSVFANPTELKEFQQDCGTYIGQIKNKDAVEDLKEFVVLIGIDNFIKNINHFYEDQNYSLESEIKNTAQGFNILIDYNELDSKNLFNPSLFKQLHEDGSSSAFRMLKTTLPQLNKMINEQSRDELQFVSKIQSDFIKKSVADLINDAILAFVSNSMDIDQLYKSMHSTYFYLMNFYNQRQDRVIAEKQSDKAYDQVINKIFQFINRVITNYKLEKIIREIGKSNPAPILLTESEERHDSKFVDFILKLLENVKGKSNYYYGQKLVCYNVDAQDYISATALNVFLDKYSDYQEPVVPRTVKNLKSTEFAMVKDMLRDRF